MQRLNPFKDTISEEDSSQESSDDDSSTISHDSTSTQVADSGTETEDVTFCEHCVRNKSRFSHFIVLVQPTISNERKKSVRFADDCGCNLFEVKVRGALR